MHPVHPGHRGKPQSSGEYYTESAFIQYIHSVCGAVTQISPWRLFVVIDVGVGRRGLYRVFSAVTQTSPWRLIVVVDVGVGRCGLYRMCGTIYTDITMTTVCCCRCWCREAWTPQCVRRCCTDITMTTVCCCRCWCREVWTIPYVRRCYTDITMTTVCCCRCWCREAWTPRCVRRCYTRRWRTTRWSHCTWITDSCGRTRVGRSSSRCMPSDSNSEVTQR